MFVPGGVIDDRYPAACNSVSVAVRSVRRASLPYLKTSCCVHSTPSSAWGPSDIDDLCDFTRTLQPTFSGCAPLFSSIIYIYCVVQRWDYMVWTKINVSVLWEGGSGFDQISRGMLSELLKLSDACSQLCTIRNLLALCMIFRFDSGRYTYGVWHKLTNQPYGGGHHFNNIHVYILSRFRWVI